MPPPPLDVLPVPRTVLGATSHANVAAYDGIHARGAAPAPVKFYPPPPRGEPLSAEAAVIRLQAAQGPRGHARAFAASVAASASATVPSVMMRKKRNENAVPQPQGDEDLDGYDDAGRTAAADGGAGGGSSSVGVSAPLGYARPAASAAASVHMAALREEGPLQPAGPYPMVAAALAVGTPGTGASTWEQAKMRALMSLEQQRDVLRAQGIAGRRLDRLMGSAWVAYARRLLVLRISRALHLWRRIAARNRRLAWAQSVWRQKHLEGVFTEWHMFALARRHERQTRRRAHARYQRTVLQSWSAAAAQSKRVRRLLQRAQLARCRRLLAGWAQRSAQLREKRIRLQGASAHRLRVLLRNGWRGLALEVAHERKLEAALRLRLNVTALRAALQTWVANTKLAQRLDAMWRRGVLRSVLRRWVALAARSAVLRRKVAALQGLWRLRRLDIFVASWAAVARRLAQLGKAELALRDADRHQLLATCLTCIRLAPRERAWARRRAVVALRMWRDIALRAARNRRLVLARHLARNRASLAAIFDIWRVLAKIRSVQLHLREIHRLQDLEPTFEHQMELVRQDRAAVQAHMRAVMEESNLLRAELLRGFVMGAEGGLLGKPLHWRSLPADPDQWMPQPRSRHSTLFLPALQLPSAPPAGSSTQPLPMHSTLYRATMAAAVGGGGETMVGDATGLGQHLGTTRAGLEAATLRTATITRTAYGHGHHADVEAVVPGVAGVLVVFGGVSEEEWFRDLHVLELAYSGMDRAGLWKSGT
ncbi:hypothetical protein GPECTOR_1g208 [Gonium pectorale]|uniref:Sfi1 spindle body domain-containing protein n=1 Tax=Gonium pectorale TaxID=33097 RepID=A0A150H269_GONPE|nr:hypothetical protein GPECTOR_1g208 [Gonium pectorale]|eukprot:KXZ56239.1 hypothetical protein GPECTOR_1g208 [Gonium pectorale]